MLSPCQSCCWPMMMEAVLQFALKFQIAQQNEKSADACKAWMQSMACGRYLEHLADIVSILTDSAALEECGFRVNPVHVASTLQRASDGELSTEDEFSHVLGQMVCECLADRKDRCLFIF